VVLQRVVAHHLKRAALVGVLIGGLGAGLALPSVGVGLDLEENVGLKWLFLLRGPIEPPPGVVVVNTGMEAALRLRSISGAGERWPCLDDIEQHGRESWPRCLHAALVATLHQRGVEAIAFDITFADDANWDADFAASIDLAGNVILQSTYQIQDGAPMRGRLSTRLLAVARGIGPWLLAKDPSRRIDRYWTFNPQLDNAPTLPVVALQVCARPLLPSLFKALGRVRPDRFAALAALDPEAVKSVAMFGLMQDVRVGIKELPGAPERLLAEVRPEIGDGESVHHRCLMALIRAYGGRAGYFANFYGPLGTIRTIDGDALLEQEWRSAGALPQDGLQGAVAFVGVSDSNMPQRDAHFTVFSRPDGIDLTGVEIAATAFANLLTDRPIRQMSNLQAFLSLLVFGLLAGVAACAIPGLGGSFASVALGITYAAIAQLQFVEFGIWMFVFIPVIVQLPLAVLSGAVLQRLDARRQRANMQHAVEFYVPKDVAETIAQQGSIPRTAEMTYGVCLTTDIVGFTTKSQRESPQDLTAALNRHFALISRLPKQYGCKIFNFTADRMMCVWRNAEPDRGTRLNACLAALEIRDRIDAFNREHLEEALPIRIGLNAGQFALANIGGDEHGDYGPVGEIPNGAERIEGLNKILKTSLLASAPVVEDIKELKTRRIGLFIPYGMIRPLDIFEIIGLQRDIPADDLDKRCRQYASALKAFESGAWGEAMALFEAMLAKWPKDGPAQFFRDKSRDCAAKPPTHEPPWVIHVETK
jgi:adenylate cyclase